MMMMMLNLAEEFGWQGPRVMEGPRLRDASYSRQPHRPTVPAAASKKLRHIALWADWVVQNAFEQCPQTATLKFYFFMQIHNIVVSDFTRAHFEILHKNLISSSKL